MNSFSDANIAKAIDRVPVTSTADLLRQMETAKTRGIQSLVKAIEAEIAIRGPVKFDKASAEQHARWAEQVGDADVEEAIVIAFNELPIRDEERLLARQIAENPGISYQDLTQIRGKGDVGLILGHMIYERLGFFRRFVKGEDRISDILFEREETSGKVQYRLTGSAEKAFKRLEII